MNGAQETLVLLIGMSLGLFVLISLLVLVPGRSPAHRAEAGPVWLGGPGRGERGVSTSGLVLADQLPRWAPVPESDWIDTARTAEPGGRTGGASAGW
ncbi:hypothetical protein [Nonomuraea sp. NPDC048916]|uniref:hypothetical protein n=1 Tax=Nonomuraea sp. NPDC048916 TaxID=3154232 RepID=UPI0033D7D627